MGKLIDETFAKQLLSDMDRIIETLKEIQGSGKVEKKEPRKLADVISENRCLMPSRLAEATIDAVIECYEEWKTIGAVGRNGRLFPEYLKEKLGNE